MRAVGTAPNIVVILADDLGWGDLGSYGSTAIRTPRLDELAARGVRFADAHASSAVCTPSRYSLITGAYPWRSPVPEGVLGGADPSILAPGIATIATELSRAGYRTGAFGKWHLGLDWRLRDGSRLSAFDEGFAPDMQGDGRDIDYRAPFLGGPLDHGFDDFFGIAGSLDMPPYCFLRGRTTVGIPNIEKTDLVASQRPGLKVSGWRDDAVDTTVLSETIGWISEHPDRPFFAYLATAAPHRPCVPPAFMREASDAGPRGDAVALVDWMVGEIVEALDAQGRLEETIIVFTSDNGAPTMFPEDGDVERHRPNGPWRGQKADAWEAGHRVPLIVAGPTVAAGALHEATVSLLDVGPTLVELAGTPAADGVFPDGVSFGPALAASGTTRPSGNAEATDAPRRSRTVLGHQAFDGTLVLRDGPDKAIYGSGSGGFSLPNGRPLDPSGTLAEGGQFYDLGRDPEETENLWAWRRDHARELYERFVAETDYTPTAGIREAATVSSSPQDHRAQQGVGN